MDLSNYTIEQLQILLQELQNDYEDLNGELQTVKAIQYPKISEFINKLKQQEKRKSSFWIANNYDDDVLSFMKCITNIDSVNMSEECSINEDCIWFLYTFKVRFNLILVEMKYRSNMPFSCNLQNKEIIKGITYQILEPNIQGKLKNVISFLQTGPKYCPAAILFFQSLSELFDGRMNILNKLKEEYEQNITILNISKTDNFGIVFLGTTENTAFLIIKWYLVWDKKTMLAKDLFKIELCAYDELKELANKIINLNTALSCTEEAKYNCFKSVVVAVKDIDTRVYLE